MFNVDNFHGINVPTMADFKLPTWDHWAGIWEEMYVACSPDPIRVSSSTPQLVAGSVLGTFFLIIKVIGIQNWKWLTLKRREENGLQF